jgi:transcriptional regulator with XRE-family HTH domain
MRRRTPGLRREDVAALCGVSVTWYTWIEQGRATAISVQTLEALAQGLRLSSAERAYLFQLAARADPSPPLPPDADQAQLASLARAIRAPAYILDPHWEALAWNRAAAELFADWLGAGAAATKLPPESDSSRNLLRYVFRHPRASAFILDWEERARQLVAQYRSDTPMWRDDRRHEGLVRELVSASPAFAAAWRS